MNPEFNLATLKQVGGDNEPYGGIVAFLAKQRDDDIISEEDYEEALSILEQVISNAANVDHWQNDDDSLSAVKCHALSNVKDFMVVRYPQLDAQLSLLLQRFLTAERDFGGRD